jgi:broad specificity phosphatase PhoE
MKPKRIIIVRHGESQSNADKSTRSKIQDHNIDLTARGVCQSKAVGVALDELINGETVGVWVAPFKRARRTSVHALNQMKRAKFAWVREDPRIREQEWGHLRDVKTAIKVDKQRDAYSRFWYRIPDGESGADVFDRISTFLETLHRDFRKKDHPKNLVIFTHGYTSRIILMKWLHWLVEQFEAMNNPPNCGYFVLELQKSGRYKLVRCP